MTLEIQSLWAPEAQFSSWLSASFLLMTVSLLFYHMTRKQSLEMSPRVAGFFSVTLILIAVIITVLALYTYFIRITELLKSQRAHLTPAEKKEQQFKYVYMAIGIAIMLIELSLCTVIIFGTIPKPRQKSLNF